MVLAVSLHAWLYVLFSIILVTLTTRWLNKPSFGPPLDDV